MILTVWYKVKRIQDSKEVRQLVSAFCPIEGQERLIFPKSIERDNTEIEFLLYEKFKDWKNFTFEFKEIN